MPTRRGASPSVTALPTTTGRRTWTSRGSTTSSPSRPSARAGRACSSKRITRARLRWSSTSPWAWSPASPRPSGRSMPSSRRTRSGRASPDRPPRQSFAPAACPTGRRPAHPPRTTREDEPMTTATRDKTTHTLDVPGASLTYDVWAGAATDQPPLVLIGSPMGAGGFTTLAGHFPDRTVVSYDPRNNGERSPVDDPSIPITTEVQAEDVHRVIDAVGGGPVDLFGSSGGAIVALALITAHPDDLRVAVAH